MTKTHGIVVFVTASNKEEADNMTRALLDQRKVACVNIVPVVDSSFWWKGKLESARESLLVMKSRAEALTDIIRLVKENHSYEVPEIIALPIIGGNEDYLRWLEDEVEV